jgi:hypothetical protein
VASIFDRTPGARFPRGQKFQITQAGLEAEDRYQAALQASRERGGRAALDEATAAWASALGVTPGDAVYLTELRAGTRTISDLAESLESAGATKAEAKAAIERLIKAGLADPVPA